MYKVKLCILLALVFTLSSGQFTHYYVTNSPELVSHNGSCYLNGTHLNPCVTVASLVSGNLSLQFGEDSNISLVFLHNYYDLKQERVKVQFASHNTVELRPWINQSHTFLNCSGELAFEFADVQQIAINSVIFHDCGDSNPAISINVSYGIIFQNSHFHRSRIRIFSRGSRIVVQNCLFKGSFSSYAIELNSSTYISGHFIKTTFLNNTGGSLHISTGATGSDPLRFKDCMFLNNSLKSHTKRSVVVDSLQDVYITDCVFDSNEPGGAIKVGHYRPSPFNISLLEIENCLFSNNTARYGGAVQVTNNVHFFVLNSIFLGNSAKFSGGAFAIDPSVKQYLPSRNSLMRNCTFYNNSAQVGGGATFITSPNINNGERPMLTVQNSTFGWNAARKGGALSLIIHKIVTLKRTRFIGNKAGYAGGAIHCQNTILSINRCSFYRNSAATRGGGLNIEMLFVIKKSLFLENYASKGSAIFADIWLNSLHTINSTIFIRNRATKQGGAITCISRSPVLFINCTFIRNSASYGGAIACLSKLNILCKFWINITGCNFTTNAAMEGGGVASSSRCSMMFSKSSFQKNRAESGGAVFFKNKPYEVVLSQCSFDSNMATRGGAIADYGPLDDSHLTVKECRFVNNSAILKQHATETRNRLEYCQEGISKDSGRGGAIVLRASNATTIMNSDFEHNRAYYGGVLYAYQSGCVVKHSTSVGNEACIGGAYYLNYSVFHLEMSSIVASKARVSGGGLYSVSTSLKLGGSMNFYENVVTSNAGVGGAIRVMDRDKECLTNSCPIVWTNDTKLNFRNNTAVKGSVMYGGMLDRCNTLPGGKGRSALNNIVRVDGSKYDVTSHAVSSEPIKFCFCQDNIPLCEQREISRKVFPGHRMELQVACVDQLKQPVPCTVRSEYEERDIELGKGENSRYIEGCSTLSFKVFSKENTVGVLNQLGSILCIDNAWRRLRTHFTVLSCPVGFQDVDKECKCDQRLTDELSRVECNISNQSITLNTPGWFSYSNGYLRMHTTCPLNYCFSQTHSVHTSSPDTQCKHHHGGILCGGCVANYSVVLGSWKCMDCSHLSRYNFIWLTVLLALAGVVLVVFLLLVKMTVSSGTTNGLILYANILSFSGLLDYRTCSIHPVLRVFLSWINLDLGIEVCYYSGMDVYQKTWLQFVFPFYIWFLVGVIILFCHYSSRVMKLMGMRNIEVLATLFLLSYAKLLKTIVTAFSYTDIKVGTQNTSNPLINQRVWVYDGSISFLNGKHLILLTTALIILTSIFVPYTFLLMFGQCLKHVPQRKGLHWVNGRVLTTFLDSYHAPYTKRHRYWTGLGLLVRCCLFTLFGMGYSLKINFLLIVVFVLVIFMVRLSGNRIYRRMMANVSEVFFLGNLGFLALGLLYRGSSCALLTASVTLSFVGFIFILGYHVHSSISSKKICIQLWQYLRTEFKVKRKQTTAETEEVEVEETQACSVSYFQLRETLDVD